MGSIHLTHDGDVEIATGRSRKETQWRNKTLLWSDLLIQLSTTKRTGETYAKYISASRDTQSRIKDVGGFVGGYLTGGRRINGSILSRRLLTLDVDFANLEFWSDFAMIYNNAACLYSTHKHHPDQPRMRLVMPLSREVRPDEYEAIGRRIAGIMDIELFDPTTFQASRLMYWPSTSKDGEFLFEWQDGPWLDADKILSSYRNWSDVSEWPLSEKVDKIILSSISKQGDPLDKQGVVGAFCRTYSVTEAIAKFLPGVYVPCEREKDRYSYAHGSTSSGLVVYEDKFVFSHHGSDPIANRLCNAFDMVRLHLFGEKDETAKEGTPTNRLPSYTAMSELATTDVAVKRVIASEKLNLIENDFGDDLEEEEGEDSTAWLDDLDMDKKGNILSTIKNIQAILRNDPAIKGRIANNLFSRKTNVIKALPWDQYKFKKPREWEDDDLSSLKSYLCVRYGWSSVGKDNIRDVLADIRRDNAYHPIKNYLDPLEWDGAARIDTLFMDFLGAEDCELNRAMTRKSLVAAVKRIYEPGCKFDYITTLIGREGLGKSTLLSLLTDKDYYTDTVNFNMLSGGNGKMLFEAIQGFWIIELPEMSGLSKAESAASKAFITSSGDNYRGSHKEETNKRYRQCVFFGNSNDHSFLRHNQGNRRFWPIPVGLTEPRLRLSSFTDAFRDQLWAEAKHYYHEGEQVWLNKELEAEATKRQSEHTEEDSRVGLVQQYLDTLLPAKWNEMDMYERINYLNSPEEMRIVGTQARTKVCVAEIWCECMGNRRADMNAYNTKSIHSIMENLGGWKRANGRQKMGIYGLQYVYAKG